MSTRRKFISGIVTYIACAAFTHHLYSFPARKRLKNFGFISGIIGKELEVIGKLFLNRRLHSDTLK